MLGSQQRYFFRPRLRLPYQSSNPTPCSSFKRAGYKQPRIPELNRSMSILHSWLFNVPVEGSSISLHCQQQQQQQQQQTKRNVQVTSDIDVSFRRYSIYTAGEKDAKRDRQRDKPLVRTVDSGTVCRTARPDAHSMTSNPTIYCTLLND